MRLASLSLLSPALLALAAPLAACGSSDPGGQPPAVDGATPDGTPGNPDGGVPDAPVAIDAGLDAPPPPQQLRVCETGAPYATIGAAIAAAGPGDTLRVCAGTYRELVVVDKPLTIVSEGGVATIDGGELGTTLTVRNVPAPGVTVQGFGIIKGRTMAEGGAVRCEASTLALLDDALTDSTATGGGGGLYATGCALDVQRTRVTGNHAWPGSGGGVMLLGSTGTIADGVISGNDGVEGGGVHQRDITAADGTVVTASTVALVRNDIRTNRGHRGGGVYQDANATLDGNMIVANDADWTGGGAFIVGHAPMITGNTIAENTSTNDGGGIYLHQSQATLQGNTVRANVSDDDGGGIRVFESAAMIVANTIIGNQAGDGGGGVRVSHVPATLVDNIVRENMAGGTGGGMDLDNDSSTVRGGEIANNRAGGSGGGIFAWLGPWNGHHFEDVVISGNHAWQGGGIYLVDELQPVVMRGLKLEGNTAAKGAGLMVSSTTFTLTNTLFADNVATDRGGAIFAGASAPWRGLDGVSGACPCPPAAPTGRVDFTVLARNRAPRGAGVWTAFPALAIGGSILHAQDGTAIEVDPGTDQQPAAPAPAITYSDVYPAMFAGMAAPTGVDGNLAVDPLFVDAAGGDFHLQPGSACIDAAAPTLVDGDGSRADMGMFGGTP